MGLKFLVLAAHADDETLGCGGWIQQLSAKGHDISVVLMSDGEIALRGYGINNRESFLKALSILGISKNYILGLPDQKFDTLSIGEIANRVLELKINPDIVISHSPKDLNADHRIASEVAKIVARPKAKPVSVFEMEIPAGNAWNSEAFAPQFYVDISKNFSLKIEAFKAYQNEIHEFPHPYSLRALEVMAQFRGMESGHHFAEAYRIVRLMENHSQI